MKQLRVLVTALLVLVFVLLGFVPVVQGVREADLDFYGAAYEVNRDISGNLYVSDPGAQKIWKINPSSGNYVTYSFSQSVRDAQIDNSNRIWWTNNSDTFGYVNPSNSTVTQWTLTSDAPYTLQALTPDNQGGVWIGEFGGDRLFHFNPVSLSLCVYDFGPIGGLYARDLVFQPGFQSGYLWLDQWV